MMVSISKPSNVSSVLLIQEDYIKVPLTLSTEPKKTGQMTKEQVDELAIQCKYTGQVSEELVNAVIPLMHLIAYQQQVPHDEVLGEGTLALHDSVKKWDSTKMSFGGYLAYKLRHHYQSWRVHHSCAIKYTRYAEWQKNVPGFYNMDADTDEAYVSEELHHNDTEMFDDTWIKYLNDEDVQLIYAIMDGVPKRSLKSTLGYKAGTVSRIKHLKDKLAYIYDIDA